MSPAPRLRASATSSVVSSEYSTSPSTSLASMPASSSARRMASTVSSVSVWGNDLANAVCPMPTIAVVSFNTSELVQLPGVAADHALLLPLGHADERLLDHLAAVRPVVAVVGVVGGPHHVVDTDEVPHLHGERLADERDQPVAPEVLRRELLQGRARPHAVAPPVVVHVLEEVRDPTRTRLGRHHLQPREAVEDPRVDELAHEPRRVADRPAHPLEARQPARAHRRLLARPGRAALARLRQAHVDVDRHLLLLGDLPERVVVAREIGVAGRVTADDHAPEPG